MAIYIGSTKVKPANIKLITHGSNIIYQASKYKSVFANNTLAEIKEACQNNEIPDTWVVGDYKEITYTYNGNSYTDRIVLVDKTEGRYVYNSDGSYTHATFMILPSREDTELTASSFGGTSNKKYSANDTLLRAVQNLESRYYTTSSDGTNLRLLLETIKIKSMTGSSSTVEDFACMLFIPSSLELGNYIYTNNTTASYKTGSNLGNFQLFVNMPITGGTISERNNYNSIFKVTPNSAGEGPAYLWSRDYGGSTDRYAFYSRSDAGFNKGRNTRTCADIVCFSW